MNTATLPHPGLLLRPIAIRATRWAPTVARGLLGAIFFVFGLDWFLHFMPHPNTPIPTGAMALAGALMGSGYMFPLIKGTEVVVGALLLSNRFVPLAITLIAPVIVNIVAFHVFLAPSGCGMAGLVLGLELYLAWVHRASFAPLFVARVRAAAEDRSRP